MKRSPALALAVLVALAPTACGSAGSATPAPSAASLASGQPTSVSPGTSAAAPTVTVTVVPSPTKTLTFADVRQQSQSSVVRLEQVTCGGRGGTGTGFFVDERHIVTAAHVVNGAATMHATTLPGSDLRVVGVDTAHDVALLRITPAVDRAGLAFAEAPRASDHVLILGFPLGVTELRSSEGTINGLEGTISEMQGRSRMNHLIVIDNAVSPGNSGGPVLNAGGDVVGMVIAKMTQDMNGSDPRQGFAVHVDQIRGNVESWRTDATLPTIDCRASGLHEEGLTLPRSITPTDSYARSAALTVAWHGQYINVGDYERAWALLTDDDQRKVGGFEQWRRDVKDSIWRYLGVPYVDVNGSRANVSAVLQTTQPASKGHQGQTCSIFQLTYQLERYGDGWRINRARYLDGFDAPTSCLENDNHH